MAETQVRKDPLTARADERVWRRWLRTLLVAAWERVAAAGLLVVGAFILCSASLWLFASIVDELLEGETQAVDDAVLTWLRGFSHPILDDVAHVVTAFGSEALALIVALVLAAFTLQRRWGAAVALLVVTVGAQLLNNVLKEQFQRLRPTPVASWIAAQQWSFPSGHATMAAAVYLFLAYVGWRALHRGRRRARWIWLVWPALLVGLVLAIDVTRLYLGVHYLSDVIAGNAIGAAWAAAVIAAGDLLAARRRPRDAA